MLLLWIVSLDFYTFIRLIIIIIIIIGIGIVEAVVFF